MNWKGTHLTYCMNIHRGERWIDVSNAINKYSIKIKNYISPDKPFGIGLRLSMKAAKELILCIDDFKKYLYKNNLYIFTINGFVYGNFYGKHIKEKVYQPDWSKEERLSYTKLLGKILVKLLPENVDGSISSIPVCYGKTIPKNSIKNLIKAGEFFYKLARNHGKKIILALEPEPDCLLATTEETIQFWKKLQSITNKEIIKFIGVCVDTCHFACEFEDLSSVIYKIESAGILIPKIQITSAIRLFSSNCEPKKVLLKYLDPIYLHQTRVLLNGRKKSFPDLLDALKENPKGEWRIHYHVPLYYDNEKVGTTAYMLDKTFFSRAIKPNRHLEIETYTFNILPGVDKNVVKSIVKEFHWLFNKV
jgi:hypothetical protein